MTSDCKDNECKKSVHDKKNQIDSSSEAENPSGFSGVFILINGLLEMISVSALVPLMSAILEPDKILSAVSAIGTRVAVLRPLTDTVSAMSAQSIMILLLIGLVLLFVMKNLFSLYLTYRQNRFVFHAQHDLGCRMLRALLNMPYEEYLSTDISSAFRLIDIDVSNTFQLILALLHIATELIVAVFLCSFLVYLNPQMMLILIVVMIAVTFIISKSIKPELNRLGTKRQEVGDKAMRWKLDSLYGFKDIRALGRQSFFIDGYHKDGQENAGINTKYAVLNQLPRNVIETIGMVAMFTMIIFFILRGGETTALVAQMAAIGIAAVTILPGVNRINTYIAEISYRQPGMDSIYDYLQHGHRDTEYTPFQSMESQNPVSFSECIRLDSITYSYPGTDRKIFDHACLEIPKGSSVGIKGASGAGKTTIVDILLGLLRIQDGDILCDSRSIFKNYDAWLSRIVYIPQTIYLVDKSIRENVAFGIRPEDIDDERVCHVLSDAQLDAFINDLPEGIHTTVGDRGIRIFGGQRQRIGIARALYHDPEILILDEATSALDNETEAAFMDAINVFTGRKTMIIIAHRMNTIRNCDIIYDIRDGKAYREKG